MCYLCYLDSIYQCCQEDDGFYIDNDGNVIDYWNNYIIMRNVAEKLPKENPWGIDWKRIRKGEKYE